MKKIININLSGRLIPIEDTAYELLRNYIDSLARYFEQEEGGDEIVSDIENRIAELFQEKLRKGAHCITDQDVEMMVDTIGRPEQLEEETSTEPQQKHRQKESAKEEKAADGPPRRLFRNKNDKLVGGVCSGIANYFNIDPAIIRIITFLLVWAYGLGLMVYIVLWIALPEDNKATSGLRRRLYRDMDHRVIGGVASGIAAYFKVDIVIPRIIFVLPLLGVIFTGVFRESFHIWGFNHVFFPFSAGVLPTLVILYIILWIVVPKAATQAEKLEMKGEKVDLQSLSNAYKSSEGEKKKINTQQQATTPPSDNKKSHGGIAEVFGTLVRIFLYFVLAVIAIALFGTLIGLAGGFLGITALTSAAFPLKSILLSSMLQKVLLWPAVMLTFGIPIVALIWVVVRMILGFRHRFRLVGLTLFVLWLIGVICAVSLLVSVSSDFRKQYSKRESLEIIQPKTKLILKTPPSNKNYSRWNDAFTFVRWRGWMDDFIGIGDDSVKIKYVRIFLETSEDSGFHLQVVRFSNGRTIKQAKHYAQLMSFPIDQRDSILYVPDGYLIPKTIPFRNQHIALKIWVPEGKEIDFRNGLSKLKDNQQDFFDDEGWERDLERY